MSHWTPSQRQGHEAAQAAYARARRVERETEESQGLEDDRDDLELVYLTAGQRIYRRKYAERGDQLR